MGELLEKVGWSKRHFARLMDVDERTVQDWCSGRVSGASYRAGVRYLALVARALGV